MKQLNLTPDVTANAVLVLKQMGWKQAERWAYYHPEYPEIVIETEPIALIIDTFKVPNVTTLERALWLVGHLINAESER
jgi:hypothetical protein